MKNRIQILDGFRAVSILSVLLYHFFSRWTPPHNSVSLYPYNNKYDFFEYGSVGVEFFFIISGFVIYFTLENTNTFKTFWVKRFIRLFPAMLFASVLTFVVFTVFDRGFLFPQSHSLRNFLPSLSFINPAVFQLLHINVSYLNGSYWSLWPEVEFYLFASVLYFINRAHFFRNFIFASAVLIGIHQVFFKHEDFSSLGLLAFLPFFAMGTLFYQLWKIAHEGRKPGLLHFFSLIFFVENILYSTDITIVRFIYVLMVVLFLVFIYTPRFLGILGNRGITSIGTSSYFLYLIHQNIGVLLINKFGGYFEPAGYVCTVFVILGLLVFSNWFTEKVEKKYSGVLKTMLLRGESKRAPLAELRPVAGEEPAGQA